MTALHHLSQDLSLDLSSPTIRLWITRPSSDSSDSTVTAQNLSPVTRSFRTRPTLHHQLVTDDSNFQVIAHEVGNSPYSGPNSYGQEIVPSTCHLSPIALKAGETR